MYCIFICQLQLRILIDTFKKFRKTIPLSLFVSARINELMFYFKLYYWGVINISKNRVIMITIPFVCINLAQNFWIIRNTKQIREMIIAKTSCAYLFRSICFIQILFNPLELIEFYGYLMFFWLEIIPCIKAIPFTSYKISSNPLIFRIKIILLIRKVSLQHRPHLWVSSCSSYACYLLW